MRIAVVNAHWNNRGDEAAHRALWRALLERYPGSELTILFKDRKPITWFPDIPNATYYSAQFSAPSWDVWLSVFTLGRLGRDPVLRATVRTLSQSDLILYAPGGAVISDRFYWSKQLEYLVPFLCARIHRIPMVVAAPSMGPFDMRPRRRLRKWLLRTPCVFCVREDISRRYLATIGIKDRVEATTDLAFIDEVNPVIAECQLAEYPDLHAFFERNERVVGITLSDFRWHVALREDPELSGRIAQTFREMIHALVARGYGVLLIPQLFGNQNDVDYLQTFLEEGVHLMSEKPDVYAQQWVISKLYAVIGMRYHSNIFAAKMGVPFIAVVYEEKMAGFLELAGLEDYGLSLEDLSFESLDGKFRSLEAHAVELAERIRAALPEWRRCARRMVERLPEPVGCGGHSLGASS